MLIECRECKREVSDTAAACPHCGHPIKPAQPIAVETPKTPSKKGHGCLITLGIIAALVIIGSLLPKQPEQPQAAGPATTPNGVPLEKQDATYITDYPSAAVLGDIDKVVRVVRANGYRCDSVSSYQPYLTSRGFELECNHFAYKYDFEDKGRGYVLKPPD